MRRQVHLMAIQSTGNATKVCNHQTRGETLLPRLVQTPSPEPMANPPRK